MLKWITDTLLRGEFKPLLWLPPAVFCLTLVLSVLNVTRQIRSSLVSMKIGFSLQERLYKKYLSMDILYHFRTPLGEKMSRISFDTAWIVQGAMVLSVDILLMPIMLLTYFVLMIYTDWKLAALMFLSFPAVLVAGNFISRRLKRTSSMLQQMNAELSRHLASTIGGIVTVKAFRQEDFEFSRFTDILKDYLKGGLKDASWQSFLKPASNTINMSFFCFAGWFAFYRLTVTHDLSIADFVAFSTLLLMFNGEIKKITDGIQSLTRAAASYERMDTVMELQTLAKYTGSREYNVCPNIITAKNLEFAYGDSPILSNINLEIRKGEFIAISGLSGAGKTTFVRLLVGLMFPQKGHIRVDGIDLLDLSPASLRAIFSYVPQTNILFDMSIRRNIAYGAPMASEDEILQASKLACAHDFIKHLPNGYDTLVGEMGEHLSGGQRQCVAIARAVLMKTPVIVLDECFANIDIVTEKRIYNNLLSLEEKKTLVVITHRFPTIQNADRIYHLANGQITEAGTHEELININGDYRQLYLIHEQIFKIQDTAQHKE
jgi:ABC-type multidrug transport system fused ATPase/permease subunit